MVAYLHSKGIIHRDIKAENVLLHEETLADGSTHERIKLTDFGSSVVQRAGKKRVTFCGTPMYMAPEVVAGDAHTEAVDVWTIGVLLYEFLVGHPPFTDEVS